LHEKFREECPQSNFTKMYVNKMINKGMGDVAEEKLDEDRLIQEEMLKRRQTDQQKVSQQSLFERMRKN
jgi:hypothetical protein